MGQPGCDDDLVQIRLQLAQLVRTLDQLTQCKDLTGPPTGVCIDTYLTASELIYLIDLPGVDVNSLKISLTREALVIEGLRPRPPVDCAQGYLLAERPFGPFKRTLDLPVPVDTSQAGATHKNGVLTIRLPRMAERRGRVREVPIRRATD
jgi:HSP20 family protein